MQSSAKTQVTCIYTNGVILRMLCYLRCDVLRLSYLDLRSDGVEAWDRDGVHDEQVLVVAHLTVFTIKPQRLHQCIRVAYE
jgi:hypothetical protein